MRDSLHFFARFLRHPTTIGAVLPSSRYLASALVGDLSAFRAGDVLVEYGPGTGAMTRVIEARLPADALYLGVELDAGFCRRLRERFPAMRFHCGSVADIERILRQEGVARPRRIVSGLPFASLPAAVQRGIVAGTHAVLRPDGEFRTFQYVHAYRFAAAQRFRAAMAERFAGFTRSRPVLRNVPPAYVLEYSAPRPLDATARS